MSTLAQAFKQLNARALGAALLAQRLLLFSPPARSAPCRPRSVAVSRSPADEYAEVTSSPKGATVTQKKATSLQISSKVLLMHHHPSLMKDQAQSLYMMQAITRIL